MASSKNHPEETVAYFIVGDKLAIVTTDGGDASTVHNRKGDFKAIDESVTNGILIHYYAEPNSVSAVTDNLDIDNALELSVVDYVKKCLYMDKAGTSSDAGVAQASMAMANKHERNFKEAVQRYGVRKKDKTGGSRVVKVPNLV